LAGGVGVRVAACRREEEQSRSCILHRIWHWSAFKSAIALSCRSGRVVRGVAMVVQEKVGSYGVVLACTV